MDCMHLAACKTGHIPVHVYTICMKRQWMQVALWRGPPCQSQTPPTLFPLLSPHPLLPWVRLSLLHHPFLSGYVSITPSFPGYARTAPSPLLSWVRLFLLCRLHLLWVCFLLLHHPLSFSCGYAFSCSVTPSPVSTLPYAPVGTLPSTPSPPSPVDTLPSAPSPPPPLCMLPSAPLSTLPFACHRTGQLQTWRP